MVEDFFSFLFDDVTKMLGNNYINDANVKKEKYKEFAKINKYAQM